MTGTTDGVPTPADVRRTAEGPDDAASERALEAALDALDTLDTLVDRPVHEHVAVFAAVHDALQSRLAATED